MDFVQRIRVKLEVVRAAVRGLQRLVVGQQRDIVRAPTRAVGRHALVASEHVEIGAVGLGAGGAARCFTVARCQGAAGGDKQQAGLGKV